MSAPQLTASGNRAFNLVDIISIMNQDIGATADNAIDPAFSLLASATETTHVSDGTPVAAVLAEPTWGSGYIGDVAWGA